MIWSRTLTAKPTRPPVVLIIDDQEWSARSLESILAPNGFAVMRAYTGAKGLERAQQHGPDAVLVDANLPDMIGVEVCRRLRRLPRVGARTPILASSSERPSRTQKLDALKAGAWDFIESPVDAEELVLRLTWYALAKFESDRIRDEGLVDDITGLYNLKGLERRVQEVKSYAYRENDAMACMVLAPRQSAEDASEWVELLQQIAAALTATGRISDVIGRLGKSEFAVIAPCTDAEGAVRLAERLDKALRANMTLKPEIDQPILRVGYDAVSNVHEMPGEAQDLLMRATMALRKSKGSGNGWLTAYSESGA